MTAHATVYAARPLSAALIRSAGRGARVTSGVGRVIAIIELGAVRLTIQAMAETELAAHLAGVRALATGRCDIIDDVLLARIESTSQVLDVAIEPAPDGAGKTTQLIAALARYGHGFTFDGLKFRDPDGAVLAAVRDADLRADTRPSTMEEFSTAERDGPSAPPTPERALARAWVISAVALRSFLEGELRWIATDQIDKLRGWIADAGADEELETEEREVLETPLGLLGHDQRESMIWRSEGLEVLGWALNATHLPDHQTQVDPGAIATAIGFLAATRPPAIDPPRLRSVAELEWMARRLAGLHWRLRQIWVGGEPVDFRSFSRDAPTGAFDLVGIQLAKDDDLAIDGITITQVGRDRLKQCHAIAAERHQAIGWLRGMHRLYSKVDPVP